MVTDPAPFLSTVIDTSAALVAIVGGLLVARFVSLDSEERSNRRILTEAADRLTSARRREAQARKSLLIWRDREFLGNPDVLYALAQGVSDLDELRQLALSQLADLELKPIITQMIEEFSVARNALHGPLADQVAASDGYWVRLQQITPDLPKMMRWPLVWREAFEEIPPKRVLHRSPGRTAESFMPLNARRLDERIAEQQRAIQRVEDYEEEFRRLREDHAEIVRPDVRLWWGVGIVIAFAVAGVGLPTWVMSRGPKDLAQVQWLVYPFGIALAALLAYIVVYLVQLSSKRAPRLVPPDYDDLAPPGG